VRKSLESGPEKTCHAAKPGSQPPRCDRRDSLDVGGAVRIRRGPRPHLVYVGTQGAEPGQGVFAARLDARTGRLTWLGLAASLQRPTWIAAHPALPVLYAVSEVGNDGKSQGSVHTLRADAVTGV
jgi:hypothetical protein